MSPSINRKSMVLYPGHGFLTSATWSSMPKMHNDGCILILTMYRDRERERQRQTHRDTEDRYLKRYIYILIL